MPTSILFIGGELISNRNNFKEGVCMAFNASLLSHNEDKINESIQGLVNNEDSNSYIYGLLEMNDTYHEMDVANKIALYRNLMENADKESFTLSKVIKLRDLIAALIRPIIKFLDMACRAISSISAVEQVTYDRYKKNHNSAKFPDNSWYNNPTTIKHVKVFTYPNINNVDTNKYKALVTDLLDELGEIRKNNFTDDMIKDFNYPAIRDIAKAVYNDHAVSGHPYNKVIKNEEDFVEMIQASICVEEVKDMNYNEYINYFDDVRMGRKEKGYSAYFKAISEFKKVLEQAQRIRDDSVINTQAQEEYVTKIIARIKEVTTAYTTFINTIRQYEDKSVVYNCRFYKNNIMPETYAEAGFIHGEPFNSDTLFDNNDIRDFNRTEWLDLSLTTECFNIKYEIDEYRKRVACLEANILASDGRKYPQLVAMREAEESGVKAKIDAIFKAIANMITKFSDSFKDRISTATGMIRRNATFLRYPVKIESVKSKGDIIVGMSRLAKSIEIIPFNYDLLKNDLTSKEKFFESRILGGMSTKSPNAKRSLDYQSGMPITEYCKAYYGASMPEMQPCVFTKKDIEDNKNEIMNFLNNTRTVFSCKNDLSRLEAESKKFINAPSATQQPAADNKEQPQQPANNATNAPKHESMYYSELYHKYFTEAEIEMGKTDQNDQAQDNNSNSEEGAAYRVYLECYKDIILSKMTAAEFVYSELTQILKAHCRSYMNEDQKKAEDAASARDSGVVISNNNQKK